MRNISISMKKMIKYILLNYHIIDYTLMYICIYKFISNFNYKVIIIPNSNSSTFFLPKFLVLIGFKIKIYFLTEHIMNIRMRA